MRRYRCIFWTILLLIASVAVQGTAFAENVSTDDALISDDALMFEEDDADLNGKYGDETMRYLSFVKNAYQCGKLLSAEEKAAELNALTDPSTVEVIEFIHQGILNMEEQIFIEDFDINKETLDLCYQTMVNNYPDIYFISMKYSYTIFVNEGIIESVIPIYDMTPEERNEKQQIVDEEVEKILDTIEPGMNRFDQVAAVNNYFSSNYHYDYEHLYDDSYDGKYTMPHLFEKKEAVCQGFTLAFQYIMQKLDIPCTTAQSNEMQHIWNLVQAKEGSENWYNLDVTWDTIYYGEHGMSPYTFFLKSDYRFMNMHEQEGFGTGQDHVAYQPDDWADDDSMNDIPISDTGTQPFYSNGCWYYGKQKYDFGNPVTIYRYNSATGESEAVVQVNGEWAVPAGVYRGYCFNSVGVYENKLYYNDALNIYVYDPEVGEPRLFLAKPTGVVEGQTPIFETRIEGDTLIYGTAPDYPGNGAVVTEHSIRLATMEYIGEIQVTETGIGISIEEAEDANKLVIAFFDANGRFIGVDTQQYVPNGSYNGKVHDGADSFTVFAVYVDEKGCYQPKGTSKSIQLK